ncbi:MAG: 2-C-methyl-D-erythritol 2,4-cyclodiphosphate synthase [Candidatus Bipolaricaulota bacterium]
MSDDTLVGLGVDVHRLEEDEDLLLAGVHLDYHKGLVGHSDADVLTHAVCDALLGAAGLGDIGEHFPDSDPQYEGASSLQLLRTVVERVAERNLEVCNVDCTLLIQAPQVSPYKERMSSNLSEILAAPVNVKATTTEHLGFLGEGKGIAAQAVASLRKNRSR